jgi:hypothetical protein
MRCRSMWAPRAKWRLDVLRMSWDWYGLRGDVIVDVSVNLVPPNQCELSDCQEVIGNIIYIWDLPASPVAFGLLWCIGTIHSGPQGPWALPIIWQRR